MKVNMKTVWWSALFAAILSVTAAKAAVIPYNNPGIENPTHYNFTAATTGNITAYFYATDASFDSVIGVSINGGPVSVFGLPNHASSYGNALVLGAATAGQAIDL